MMNDYLKSVDSLDSQPTGVSIPTESSTTTVINSSQSNQIPVLNIKKSPSVTVSNEEKEESFDMDLPNYLKENSVIVKRYQLRK